MPSIALHQEFLHRRQAERDRIKGELESLGEESDKRESLLAQLKQARDVVNTVMTGTQEQVKEYVEDMVTTALACVYGNEYSFVLDCSVKRNQSEMTPWIVKGAERHSPREEVGGGVNDVAAFALRLVLWSMSEPRSAPIFILDEPAKFLSRGLQPMFGRMLQELSRMLGVQVIMVSHSADIIESADKAWSVTQRNGTSEVAEVA